MDAHDASVEAAHKAKGAQQAIETARELQQNELVERTAQKTKEALLEGLKEVFTNDADRTPKEMSVLFQRVPVLCAAVLQMHEDIKELKDMNKWVIRIVIGGVLLAGLKLVLIP